MIKLLNACQTVVNGYEGDGMECMYSRDEVFYRVCKEALISDWDKYPWAKYRTIDPYGVMTYWENKPYELFPWLWQDHTDGKIECVRIIDMESKLDERP